MFKLVGQKIISILRKKNLLNWPRDSSCHFVDEKKFGTDHLASSEASSANLDLHCFQERIWFFFFFKNQCLQYAY